MSMTRREFLRHTGWGLAAAAAARPFSALAAAGGERPNVVILFADDLGYGDLGCYGSPNIATPCLDLMAREGLRFTDFYVAGPVCTPSRAALMTGSYPARVGMAQGVLFPRAQKGLNPSEFTIAELLKQEGYATACVGKWHLGDKAEFLPTRQGFDSYFGIPYSNDMTLTVGEKKGPPLMRNEEIVEHPAVQAILTQRYTEEAVRFITTNKDKPFFLYLPYTMPHVPLHASEKFAGRSKRGVYGDAVEEIDWSVGEIRQALQRAGADRKTILVFTSDNGPWLSKGEMGGSAGPLRAGKGTTYEGGMREPCIVCWPDRVAAGRECREIATTMDLLPTLAALLGAKLPDDRVLDGRNVLPLVTGEAGARTPHEAFFYYSTGGKLEALRSGRWKLLLPRKVRAGRKAPEQDAAAELYDLEADLGEKNNLAAQHADVVERLTKLADTHREEMAKNSRPAGAAAVAGIAP